VTRRLPRTLGSKFTSISGCPPSPHPYFCGQVGNRLKSRQMLVLAVLRTGQMSAQLVAFAPGMFVREGAILRDKYREIYQAKQINTEKSSE
jgi:hypothetical protein